MHQTATLDVCPDKLVNGILRGMRRRGLPANVDADDLRQEGLIALATNRVETPAHAATIARNAMIDVINKGLRDNKRFQSLDTPAGSGAAVRDVDGGRCGRSSIAVRTQRHWSDVFFALPVDDGKAYRTRKARKALPVVDSLASRHAEWERERAERWA
jgi:DNA-directed RNA polymerase specialized sigma24 family protein